MNLLIKGVLKALATIFDPLGLITPITFFGKVFLQELWKEGISWDKSLSDSLCDKWREILDKLKPVFALKIPRFVGNVNATAIYLRTERQNTFYVNLVFSKMRLVSKGTRKKRLKKDITLPCLELLAVTMGVCFK